VTEIVSYGVIYWSRTVVALAYSAGNLAGALVGVPDGRFLQRHGPRPVTTAGSVLGALAVPGIAAAPDYGLFVGAWLAAGITSADLYYPLAFAALTTMKPAIRPSARVSRGPGRFRGGRALGRRPASGGAAARGAGVCRLPAAARPGRGVGCAAWRGGGQR
jgi:MFS family permease